MSELPAGEQTCGGGEAQGLSETDNGLIGYLLRRAARVGKGQRNGQGLYQVQRLSDGALGELPAHSVGPSLSSKDDPSREIVSDHVNGSASPAHGDLRPRRATQRA